MTKLSSIELVVLIPVLNEIENIQELTIRLLKGLGGINFIIVYIDDGSVDGTVEFIESLNDDNILLLKRIKTKKGCQRGGALYYGLQEIAKRFQVEYWCELDGDLSHQPEEIIPALELLISKKADVLIVSKYLKGSQIVGRSLVRNFISLINSLLFRLAFTQRITDYSNGYRIYNKKAASLLLQKTIVYTSPIYLGEVLTYWIKKQLNIMEIPGKYINRTKGKSEVVVQDIAEGFKGYIALVKDYYKQ